MTLYDFRELGFRSDEMAVVTGAGNGIGRSVALTLAKSGVAVAAWDMDQEGLNELIGETDSIGGRAYPVVVDLSEQRGIEDAWEQTEALGRAVHYLVNNAGPAASTELSVAEGVRIAIGSYAAVAEGFVARYASTASSMTFTASISGNTMVDANTLAWHPAAKAGIAGYMRHCAIKYRGHPRSNCVAPGGTVPPHRCLARDARCSRAHQGISDGTIR